MENKLEEPTPRQADTLAAIKKLMRKGYPPTLAEIGDEIGVVSKNATKGFLTGLEAKGYIIRVSGIARGIRLTGNPK